MGFTEKRLLLVLKGGSGSPIFALRGARERIEHLMRGILLSILVTLGTALAMSAQASTSEETLHHLYQIAQASGIEARGISSRIEFYSQHFLSQRSPYLINPLGEGRDGEFVKSPLYRFDGFDCTTFVETVLALSIARTPEEFKKELNQIRYDKGYVSYEARNHFPSVDWIPNNSKAGLVEDITGIIAGARTRWSQTWIEKDEWLRKKGPGFQKISRHFKKELGRIPYIAKEDLFRQPDLMERIPSGAIFHVVRPNWDLRKVIGTKLDVSHMGFLIRERGVLYMIHASNGMRDGGDDYQGVKKEPLIGYIERVMMESPSMAGFNILFSTKK